MPVLKYKMIVVELRGDTYRVADKGLSGFDYEILIDGKFTPIDVDNNYYVPYSDYYVQFSDADTYNIEMLFDTLLD